MKHISIILFAAFCFSCNVQKNNQKTKVKDNTISTATENSCNTSKEAWLKLKKDHSSSYIYSVNFSSYTGYNNSTKITVKKGVVVQREYFEYNPASGLDLNAMQNPIYTENKGNINSHNNGSPAITIDEIYDTCLSTYLMVNETENTIRFTTDDAGILKSCGYTPNNCADDCFKGTIISEFNWLN